MTAFRATFADMKLVKTRQVAQLIFEVPIEQFDAAYEVLGGMPVPSKERWFGIAALKQESEVVPNQGLVSPRPDKASPVSEQDKPQARAKREKMDWRELQPTTQAGIRCEDPIFKAFLDKVHSLAEWNGFTTAAAVRALCGVKSRSELSTNHKARVLWHQLDSQFLAWKAVEHA